jgi:hypothetical protein
MGRSSAAKLILILAGAALLLPQTSLAGAQVEQEEAPLPVFELHSGFWINLHHTLYAQARLVREGKALPVTTRRTPSEQFAWDAAISYYRTNYADMDPLFSTELILLKDQLGEFEGCDELTGIKKKTCDAGLPPRLARVLEAAAPAYRAHEWPEHDRVNRRWIASVAPLVRERGLGLAQRLAEIYQTRWPKDRIRVDITAYANAGGAYTTLDPLRVTISSTDPRNQGSAAMLILFHEASHGISEIVEDSITRECRQRSKPIPRDLWNALLFYTAGEVVRPSASQQGNVDTIRQQLFQRGWDEYLSLLRRFWQPYLDGEVTIDDAIAHMVSSL